MILPEKGKPSSEKDRCGLILAGGDGKRLAPFVFRLRKDFLPKQYVPFIKGRSLLEKTLHRAEKLIPKERIFTIVSQNHLAFPEAHKQLCNQPRERIISQPQNKETGPGLLLSLVHIQKTYANSTVAVFPSDHYISNDDPLLFYINMAFRCVEEDPSTVILLGISPKAPKPEFGYIIPGSYHKSFKVAHLPTVGGFVEKPDSDTARTLIQKGAVWNTMIMVFSARTMLGLIREASWNLYLNFHRISKAIGTPKEKRILEDTYQRITPLNFSKDILGPMTQKKNALITVLAMKGVTWNDWGNEQNIINDIQKSGSRDHSIEFMSDFFEKDNQAPLLR